MLTKQFSAIDMQYQILYSAADQVLKIIILYICIYE